MSEEEEKKLLIGTIAFYCNMFGALCKATHQRNPEQGLETIRNVSSEFGNMFGGVLKKRNPSAPLKTLVEAQDDTCRKIGWKVTLKGGDDEIEVTAETCPFGLENTSKELCDAVMDFDRNMWQTLDPKLSLYIDKTVAIGDPRCLIRVRRED